jgi:hypothetical protein
MNKKENLLLLILSITMGIGIMGISSCTQADSSKQDSPTAIDKKVDKLVGQMTLEEKIGQMTQVTLAVVSNGTVKKPDSPQQMVVDYVRVYQNK